MPFPRIPLREPPGCSKGRGEGLPTVAGGADVPGHPGSSLGKERLVTHTHTQKRTNTYKHTEKHTTSFQGSFFAGDHQTSRGNSDRFLSRTVVEKNGESIPRIVVFGISVV